MLCDDRLEVRVAAADKAALALRARSEGLTISTLLRRGLRVALDRPVRLEGEDALEVVVLRRRINSIADRLDAIGRRVPEVAAIRADLAQAHADAQVLLGRRW